MITNHTFIVYEWRRVLEDCSLIFCQNVTLSVHNMLGNDVKKKLPVHLLQMRELFFYRFAQFLHNSQHTRAHLLAPIP